MARVDRDQGALLQGARLVQAREWLAKHDDASPLLREFLQASNAAERKQAFRTKRNLSVVTALFLTLMILVYLRQETLAQAQQLSLFLSAGASLTEDPERSLILGFHSWGKSRTVVPGVEEFLHKALLQSRSRRIMEGHQNEVSSVALSRH